MSAAREMLQEEALVMALYPRAVAVELMYWIPDLRAGSSGQQMNGEHRAIGYLTGKH